MSTDKKEAKSLFINFFGNKTFEYSTKYYKNKFLSLEKKLIQEPLFKKETQNFHQPYHGISTLRGCTVVFFYLAVNKLISDKAQNIFSLMTEYLDFIRYSITVITIML